MRKPKKGYVYLLENTEPSEYRVYKYGCTTLTPEKRCKRVNYEQKQWGYEFKVIAAFKSFDIYKDEHTVRCDILRAGIGMLSEVFNVDEHEEMPTTDCVIKRFLKLGGVLR